MENVISNKRSPERWCGRLSKNWFVTKPANDLYVEVPPLDDLPRLMGRVPRKGQALDVTVSSSRIP
jgi:hypothetical protein